MFSASFQLAKHNDYLQFFTLIVWCSLLLSLPWLSLFQKWSKCLYFKPTIILIMNGIWSTTASGACTSKNYLCQARTAWWRHGPQPRVQRSSSRRSSLQIENEVRVKEKNATRVQPEKGSNSVQHEQLVALSGWNSQNVLNAFAVSVDRIQSGLVCLFMNVKKEI